MDSSLFDKASPQAQAVEWVLVRAYQGILVPKAEDLADILWVHLDTHWVWLVFRYCSK